MKQLLYLSVAFILAANLTLAAQTDEIAPGANIIVEGIPKIPASLAQKVNQYKGAYGYPVAGWDNTKRELWIKTLASTGTWVSRVETPGSIPKALIMIPVGGVYDLYYQPQGKYLVYNKDNRGNESFQFYLYDIASRQSKPITDEKTRSTEPIWSNAGDRIIYSSSPANGDGVEEAERLIEQAEARLCGAIEACFE